MVKRKLKRDCSQEYSLLAKGKQQQQPSLLVYSNKYTIYEANLVEQEK